MEKNNSTTYTYHFADGSTTTIQFNLTHDNSTTDWIAELQEMDRLEYNNQHTESRRHCSLDAQDPMHKGGYHKVNHMEEILFYLEMEEFLNSLSWELNRIAKRLLEGYTASEIARQDNVNRSTISRKVKEIRKLLKDAGF